MSKHKYKLKNKYKEKIKKDLLLMNEVMKTIGITSTSAMYKYLANDNMLLTTIAVEETIKDYLKLPEDEYIYTR